jgi:hypothetical protein
MLKYSVKPGRPSAPPAVLPDSPGLALAKHEPALLLFGHPECPCTRASLEELARIVAFGAPVSVRVLFFAPDAVPSWKTSPSYQIARKIPGVRVLSDRNGEIGRSLGAHTSGDTLFYDANGRLAFSGGITATRGHVGDNDGVDAIIDILRGYSPRVRTAPVFGCAIYEED